MKCLCGEHVKYEIECSKCGCHGSGSTSTDAVEDFYHKFASRIEPLRYNAAIRPTVHEHLVASLVAGNEIPESWIVRPVSMYLRYKEEDDPLRVVKTLKSAAGTLFNRDLRSAAKILKKCKEMC